MFWGGEMTRSIALVAEKTLPRMTQMQSKLKQNQGSKINDNVPTLELKIAAGAPSRSRLFITNIFPLLLLLLFFSQ